MKGRELNFITTLLDAATAPAAAPPAAPTSQEAPWILSNPWIVPGAIVIMMLFFMSRTKSRAGKPGEDLLKNLKRGDRIQTIGGVLGIVADVRDDEVVIKVDESSNTRIRFSRDAIRRVIVDQDKTEKNIEQKK